ncbi:2'-5' RNA ligase [Candidatus Uhrbacteria bacterium RIFCSPHIGHO2_12_FULL_57_11]|uniref:RNA 2',3'-cyclic phosphodiesterase n=2 Tax=Candidatus Uhriibacteriota TaxID=1752732 RepID=A0A1F7UKZ8_9BACT|nr:MAG: 2'-5' RNA ligase [Candidatus Uhrbacteria bacterium RIFCSPHIGHO2_02_FULL_57_19]OGL78953.1 MAG: 2'-5' RNA ligase [Candidatus Uhrbacteria bacterium RIFCSPHIGHO2_12_FULL_57_11]
MKKRVFLAVHLPEKLKRELGLVIGEMREKDQRALIKWVNGDGAHITLHFLGDQDEEAIRRISGIVRETAGEYRPTVYALDAVGFFPDAGQPRIIYVAARERDGAMLESLREKIGRRLEQIGIDVDHRTWHPHITLGRIKALGPKSETYASTPVEPREFTVDTVDLTESRLDPAGAIYTVIERFPLHGTGSNS